MSALTTEQFIARLEALAKISPSAAPKLRHLINQIKNNEGN